jgi:sugar/nucleoside kinase (ribokinase family)
VSAPDFVAIGHVTLDRFARGTRPGGAALFAAITAHQLGLTTGLLTSHADDFPLDLLPPRIEVITVPARATTVFEHATVDGERVLHARAAAGPLTAADVPEDWAAATQVLLAPVIDEVEAGVASAFTDAVVSVAAQGWLRSLGADGAVGPRGWNVSTALLARLQAVFLSAAEIRDQESAVVAAFQHVPVGIVTAGPAGALLFVNGERYEVPPRPARLVDDTGAGDVFAAAFLAAYRTGGDPWEAAEVATCAASLSVEGLGWSSVPDGAALQAALAEYRERNA